MDDQKFDIALFDACDLLAEALVEALGAQITDGAARADLADQALARASDIVHATLRAYASEIRGASKG